MTMKNKGFTLIELSIVIVIIGLIVAGIVGGQSLIKQAQLRSSIKELTSFNIALNAFKLEYDALPGDMRNATDYWNTATVDGNGDGLFTYQTEGYRAWQQLGLAELIAGNYAGTQQGADTIGTATPKSSLPQSGYGFFSSTLSSMSWAGQGAGKRGNFIRWGGIQLDGANTRIGLVNLNAKDARSVDEKMDDGLPGLGKMIIQYNNSTTCITTNVTTTADYNLSNPNISCYFNYWWNR